MNNQPSQNPTPKYSGKELLRHLGNVIRHNWHIKLGCLLMAVFLWGTLIAQDDSLTREKTFENVAISVNNASSLQRSGFIVVSGLEELENVRMTAQVPQKYYDAALATSYSVRIDLSKITEAGEVVVPVEHTRSAIYGGVTDISVENVTLVVEEYMTRSRIPVKIQNLGDMPQGLYGNDNNIVVDPEYVTVAGPRSVVASIVRCVAQYDRAALSGSAGLERTACAFVLEDATGNPVDMTHLTVMVNNVEVDSIVVEQNLYAQVSLPLADVGLITGEVAEGYRIKNVTMSPENVTFAVRNADTFDADLAYLQGAVDVSGLTQSTTVTLPISRPSDVISMNTDVAYVTVEVEKIEESEGNK